MKVIIKFLNPINYEIGKDVEHVECMPQTTVRDVFQMLKGKYGQKFMNAIFSPDSEKIKGSITVSLNRDGVLGYRRIELFQGMDTELLPNDSLIIFHPAAGG